MNPDRERLLALLREGKPARVSRHPRPLRHHPLWWRWTGAEWVRFWPNFAPNGSYSYASGHVHVGDKPTWRGPEYIGLVSIARRVSNQ